MIGAELDAAQASMIADACVTFDPYLRLGYQSAMLTNYLTRPDPALSRQGLWRDG